MPIRMEKIARDYAFLRSLFPNDALISFDPERVFNLMADPTKVAAWDMYCEAIIKWMRIRHRHKDMRRVSMESRVRVSNILKYIRLG